MKTAKPVVSIIIPAFNEEDNIARCVNELADAFHKAERAFEIVIVNDGSTDSTSQKAHALSKNNRFVRSVDLGRNLGKAAALREGIRMAKGDVIAFFDADLQYDPEDLILMVEGLENGVDVVNGRRDYDGYGMTRTMFSLLYNKLMKFVFRVQVEDSNCGLKVLKREAANPETLFQYGLPLIVPLLRIRGFKARELTVSLNDRKAGESKYFANGHVLGGRRNIWDITYHSMMMVNLYAHIPSELRRRTHAREKNGGIVKMPSLPFSEHRIQ